MDPFEFALEQGFDAFEWFPDKKDSGEGWEETDLDAEMRRRIRGRAAGQRLTLTVHAPASLDMLLAPDPEAIENTLSFASDIGASLLNLHLQLEEGIDRFLKALEPWIRGTAETGIALALENTPMTPPEDFNAFFEALRNRPDLSFDHVGMCFDLGHANLCARTRNDYLAFLDLLAPTVPIIHLHLHENYGDHDSHLCLFTGPSKSDDSGIRGIIERLQARGYDGCAILEQWPDPPDLLVRARDGLRALCPASETGDQPAPSPKPKYASSLSSRTAPRSFASSPVRCAKPHSTSQASAGRSVNSDDSSSDESPPRQKPQPPTNPFLATLLEAHRNTKSWREKLQWVHDFLTGSSDSPDTVAIAGSAVFLQWIQTGHIPCKEDSRHFRPNHHAKIADNLYGCLARIITPGNAAAIRKIYPALPSFRPSFKRSEPLTLIRDIAHRNDIPKELKDEIKHSLQNKLHRCAGPEDLRTSAKLLDRITAPGADYPDGFVAEFHRFHEELKEFFNAQSLDDRLETLADSLNEEVLVESIRAFQKHKEASKHRNEERDLIAFLEELTRLRTQLSRRADQLKDSKSQECRMAEIELEDFAFALSSDLVNRFDSDPKDERIFALRTLSILLENLELDLIAPDECRAVRAENYALLECAKGNEPEFLLRLAANLERAQRIFGVFADVSVGQFIDAAEQLGEALEIADDERDRFVETTIRRHIVFQFSKLVTSLLRSVRDEAGMPLWETLVSGKATGKLLEASRLTDLPETLSEPCIVLLEHADGEEVIPDDVRGVILKHEIPHLSHLGVRARQANVLFAICPDAKQFKAFSGHVGGIVELELSGDSLNLSPDSSKKEEPGAMPRKSIRIPKTSIEACARLIPLVRVSRECAGPKADSLRILEELAASGSPGFHTPPTFVIPFGVLDQLLSAQNKPAKKSGACGTEAAIRIKRERIAALNIPESLIFEAGKAFGQKARLVVRSSSNLEDLKDFGGAGLYDSVSSVTISSLQDAIRKVCASLWSERAVAERRRFKINDSDAHMAVILQTMVDAGLSFFMHTVNPGSKDAREAFVELAVGMGDTLASTVQGGRPYRAVLDKKTGSSNMLAFASFSHALRPNRNGKLAPVTIDYSRIAFSRDPDFRKGILHRLAMIAKEVEVAFGSPQDIEGTIHKGEIALVQSRPQHGVK